MIVEKRQWVVGFFVFFILGVMAWLVVSSREGESACSAYTHEDAISYVKRNIKGYASQNATDRVGFATGNSMVCVTQLGNEKKSENDPFIVSICSAPSGSVVGSAEVYPDCGLEWRRR